MGATAPAMPVRLPAKFPIPFPIAIPPPLTRHDTQHLRHHFAPPLACSAPGGRCGGHQRPVCLAGWQRPTVDGRARVGLCRLPHPASSDARLPSRPWTGCAAARGHCHCQPGHRRPGEHDQPPLVVFAGGGAIGVWLCHLARAERLHCLGLGAARLACG